MTDTSAPHTLLRPRREGEEARVSNVELFFDLVFVYAVTQLSHTLLKDLSALGALQTGLLFLAVWWVWIYTSWVTNWLDPERLPVRIALFVLMLAGLELSISIPEAFGPRGLAFAAAYVFMQVGRSLFMLWAIGNASPANRRNFQRITCWSVLSGLFWIAGGLAEGNLRLVFWLIALGIDYLAPSQGFRVPGLGRSTTADWDIEGGHLAERCSLFVIIALGESLLVTGATFEHLEPETVNVIAFATAFLASVAMWWIYFDTGVERGQKHILHAEDPGRMARLGYTYLHLLIVAGIVVCAVADELLLSHPHGHAGAATIAVMLGGPAAYILGNGLFKRIFAQRFPLSHLVGLILLALLTPFAGFLTAFELDTAATACLVLVSIWETLSLRRGGRKQEAIPQATA